MRSLGWPNWRNGLSNLFRTVWGPPRAGSPRRVRSSSLRVEPLEDRLAPVANLTVTTIDSPDPVVRGGTISYTIRVENTGDAGFLSVNLTDAIPANTTFESFTAPASWSSTTPPPGSTVTSSRELHRWEQGVQVDFTLVVRVDPNTSTTLIQNQVNVNWEERFFFPVEFPPPPINGSTADTEQTTVLGPDLALTKADLPDPVARGGLLTYTITVNNPGPGGALNVALTDTIPANTTFVSFAAPAGFTSTTPAVGGTGNVSSTASLLAPGNAVFTLVVRVDANAVGPVNNSATVSSLNDPNPANNSDTEQTQVLGPDLSVAKTDDPDPVARGSLLTYNLTLTNPGPGNALNVALSDAIPAGTTFVSFAAPAGFTSTTPAVGETGTVTSTAGVLAPGTAVFTLTVRVDANAVGPVSNTATVASLNDPNGLNNSATQQTTIVGPDLTLTNSGAPGLVQRGETITYTLTLNNPGPGIALNVTLTDVLPPGTTFVSINALPGFTSTPPTGSNPLTLTAVSLPPGSVVFTLVVRVDPDMLSPFPQNTATVGSFNEGAVFNNTVVAETRVIIPALPISGFEDTPALYTVARFTSTLDVSFTAVIDWGDGTTSAGTVAKVDSTTFVISSPHTYTDELPHEPNTPFPFSITVTGGGNRRFDMNGTANILDRPFPDSNRGSPEDRWLAEIGDNLRDPSLRSLNQDDAGRLAFAGQWNRLFARELARTRNIRKARRNVARRILTPAVVAQITTEILGGVPRRLRLDDIVRLIDAFYIRYLEHGGRSPSWDLAVTTLLRVSRRESVLESIRISLAEFMSSDEFFNKTVR